MVNVDNDYSLITTSGTDGTLFYCKGETVQCTEMKNPGYYVVDKNTVYTCQNKNNAIKCQKDKVSETECSAANIGRLFEDENSISLCLDNDIKFDISSSTSVNYLVAKNSNSIYNIFGITKNNEKYAIVNIKDNVVTLNSDYDNKHKYVYALKESRKILEKGDTCPKENDVCDESKILEVLCTKGTCKEDNELIIDGTSTGKNMN